MRYTNLLRIFIFATVSFVACVSHANAQLPITVPVNWRPPIQVPESTDYTIRYAGYTDRDQAGQLRIRYNPNLYRQLSQAALVFLRVHEYGHAVLNTSNEAQCDCWAASQLSRSDPEILDEVIRFLEEVIGTRGKDWSHGSGFEMAAVVRSCVQPSSSSGPVRSVTRDGDSREMRDCLSQLPEKCVAACQSDWGFSEAECRTRRCTPTETNISGWRRVCERKVEAATALREAEKGGSDGEVVARIISEAKTRFSSLMGKNNLGTSDETSTHFFSTLYLPNAKSCEVVDSKDTGHQYLRCVIAQTDEVVRARAVHQDTVRRIEASLLKGRYLPKRDEELSAGTLAGITFEAQYGFEPDINIRTSKLSGQYYTWVTFTIVDSPSVLSSLELEKVLRRVIEEAPTRFEALKGQANKRGTVWNSTVRLGEMTAISKAVNPQNTRATWSTRIASLPANDQLALHSAAVQVLKTLLPGWETREYSEENPDTHHQELYFEAWTKSADKIELTLHSTVAPGNRVENAFEIDVISPSKSADAQNNANSAQSPKSTAPGVLVSLTSEPPGAEIWIDGKFVGSTPSTVKVSPGSHTIIVTRLPYREWKRDIVVGEGETKSVHAVLDRNQ